MSRSITDILNGVRTAASGDNKDALHQTIDDAEQEILRLFPEGDPLGRDASGYPAKYAATFAPGSQAPLSPGVVSGRDPKFSSTGQPKEEGEDGLPDGFHNGNIPNPVASTDVTTADTGDKGAEPTTGDDKGADLPVTQAQRDALAAAGLDTPEKIAAATDDELKAVPGVGDATVAKLRQGA